jgi:hypothetical protein
LIVSISLEKQGEEKPFFLVRHESGEFIKRERLSASVTDERVFGGRKLFRLEISKDISGYTTRIAE